MKSFEKLVGSRAFLSEASDAGSKSGGSGVTIEARLST